VHPQPEPFAREAFALVPAGAELVDAHPHLGKDEDGSSLQVEGLLGQLDEAGVARCCVFPLHDPERHPAYRVPNDRVLEWAAASEGRLVPFCRLDPAQGAIAEAERCLARGARGIKLHPRAQAFVFGKDETDAILALGAEAGFNYATDWVKAARAATEGQGPDVIIDGTGGATFDRALDAARPGGDLLNDAQHGLRIHPVGVEHLAVLDLALNVLLAGLHHVQRPGRAALAADVDQDQRVVAAHHLVGQVEAAGARVHRRDALGQLQPLQPPYDLAAEAVVAQPGVADAGHQDLLGTAGSLCHSAFTSWGRKKW